MTERDALVDLRAWREQFARSHGYDLKAMVAALRALDAEAGDRVVSGTPRPPVSTVAEPRVRGPVISPVEPAAVH